MEQHVPEYPRPKADLEQYRTPPEIALFMASMGLSRCADGVTVDLGAGTGMISYAAAMLGYSIVVGIELDYEALEAAASSALRSALANVELVLADALHPPLRAGAITCVIQNPPFGIHRRGADAAFLRTALDLGVEAVLSLHHYSEDGIRYILSVCREAGYEARVVRRMRFPIKFSHPQHRKRIYYIWTALVLCERAGDGRSRSRA